MKLSEHCYAVLGLVHSECFPVNAGIIAGDGETAVIDTSFCHLSALTILGYARAISPENKIRYVINTESHSDHNFGNSVFKKEGAEIIAHKKTKEKHDGIGDYVKWMKNNTPKNEEEKDALQTLLWKTKFASADRTIQRDKQLEVGGVALDLICTPGHTDGNISVYAPEEKVIFVGDTIYSGYAPHAVYSSRALYEKWIKSLDRISSLDIDYLIPGHGHYLKGKKEIEKETERHRNIIKDRVKEL